MTKFYFTLSVFSRKCFQRAPNKQFYSRWKILSHCFTRGKKKNNKKKCLQNLFNHERIQFRYILNFKVTVLEAYGEILSRSYNCKYCFQSLNNLELLYKIETTLYKIKISLSQKIFSNFSATQTVRKETASFQCRILCVLTLQRTQAIAFFSTLSKMQLMS